MLLVVLFIICGCGKTDKEENNVNELSQRRETENYSYDTKKKMRNAYFLDERTIFSVEIPENWHGEIVLLNNSSQRKQDGFCYDPSRPWCERWCYKEICKGRVF